MIKRFVLLAGTLLIVACQNDKPTAPASASPSLNGVWASNTVWVSGSDTLGCHFVFDTTVDPYAYVAFDVDRVVDTSGGGVFLSIDNGASWSAVNNGLPANVTINAIAVFGGSRVFAGTTANGVFLSADNGTSWSAVNNGLPANVTVNAFAVIGSRVFAGTTANGIFLSTDNGTSWSAVANQVSSTATIYSFAVMNDSSIFAGCGEWSGVFRSIDTGTNWTQVSNGLSAQTVSALAVSDTMVFAGTAGGNGIFLSTDTGANWSAVNNGLPANVTINALAVMGTTVFAGTADSGIFLSANNGTNWTAANTGMTATAVYSLAVGNGIYAGTSGGYGVFLSIDNGASWSAVNNGLTAPTVYSLGISDIMVIAGTGTYHPVVRGTLIAADTANDRTSERGTWTIQRGVTSQGAWGLIVSDILTMFPERRDSLVSADSSVALAGVPTPYTVIVGVNGGGEGLNLIRGNKSLLFKKAQ